MAVNICFKSVFIVVLLSNNVYGQFCKRDYLESFCTYPISNKFELFKKVDTFLELLSNKDSSLKNWIEPEDFMKWKKPFDEIEEYTKMYQWYKPIIIGIQESRINEFIVKLQFNFVYDTISSLHGIYNLVVIYDTLNLKYKFKDYRSHYISNMLDTFRQGSILYYSKKVWKLNVNNCNEFNLFNKKIANIFQVKPKLVSYFLFKNSAEMFNFLGWDIVTNVFYSPTAGFAKHGSKGTSFENTIIAGNNSERYDHELVHLYFQHLLFSDTTNSTLIIFEGIPTYFGGSSELKYSELKSNLRQFLLQNDSIKIKDHFLSREVNIQIDKKTNYIYSMGAFITELYYRRKGYAGLVELANYTDDNFIRRVSNFFKVSEVNLDSFLRKELMKSN